MGDIEFTEEAVPEISPADYESGKANSTGQQLEEPGPPTDQEPVFELPDDQGNIVKVPLSQVKEWRTDSENKKNWQAAQTQRDQQLAEQRKQLAQMYSQVLQQPQPQNQGVQQPNRLGQLNREQVAYLINERPEDFQAFMQNEVAYQAQQRAGIMHSQATVVQKIPELFNLVRNDPDTILAVQEIINQHPGMSAPEAALMLALQNREKAISQAREEAKKEAEAAALEKAKKQLQSRSRLSNTNGGVSPPAARPQWENKDAMLDDAEAYLKRIRAGGVTGV